jgi:hypothetical protein
MGCSAVLEMRSQSIVLHIETKFDVPVDPGLPKMVVML